ncbi:flagellar basal body P-ring formation chaperone FlgA [Rhodoferax saidenbachensis]|uniref:Flagella basal body P-ring formation protein FlgA n=1 Tax=Rhodoferax saidenbachensis TaxID=1484693 RepID=A0ABU1ZSN6_9BURK|nr:flagellar basal body P-ring formation chaperone FlgA [Rhodoferax saidenbachensis]MDR7308550.1 flagella basal body P-ring formation protein FlgA [Rhodoferax saidenbachensis]
MSLCLRFARLLPRRLRGGLALAVLVAAPVAWAQDMALGDLQVLAQRWVRDTVAKTNADNPGLRMESTVGALDSRLRLAVCGNVEAYVPPGARLWGRSRVGLRCADGIGRWNVSLPVVVKAVGPAWVLKSQVAAGATLAESDVIEAEVDWAEEPSAVLQERPLWVGQTATRLLSAGQALRQGMVKPAQVFQAGASVRVVAQGPGFQVSSDAQALSAGVVGQQARVRMDNGRVTSGMVLDVRTVRIDL